MSVVKVIDIIKRVEYVLQDTNVRWPRIELQNWLNESYLSITLLRPDASAKTGTFNCAEGSRQILNDGFPTALRLLDVTRNLAASSSKRAVRLVMRSVLDDQRPSWHAETPTVNVQHFTFDPRQPKEFFVYPPAAATAQLEVVYSDAPSGHDLSESDLDPAGNNTEVIKIDDIYMSPIIDWMLYRAYSKDAEYGSNEARAAASYQSFVGAIGAKSESDSASTPMLGSRVT